MQNKPMQIKILKVYFGLLALVVILNIALSIKEILAGHPLDYFDLAMISGMPVAFFAGLITGIYKSGLRKEVVFTAFFNSFAVLLLVVMLPFAFKLAVFPAVLFNIVTGVIVSVALSLRS